MWRYSNFCYSDAGETRIVRFCSSVWQHLNGTIFNSLEWMPTWLFFMIMILCATVPTQSQLLSCPFLLQVSCFRIVFSGIWHHMTYHTRFRSCNSRWDRRMGVYSFNSTFATQDRSIPTVVASSRRHTLLLQRSTIQKCTEQVPHWRDIPR